MEDFVVWAMLGAFFLIWGGSRWVGYRVAFCIVGEVGLFGEGFLKDVGFCFLKVGVFGFV